MLLNNKVVNFELDPKSINFKEILNQDFLELEIKAISTANPNRNGSHFTLESLQKAIPTFYNKPILGSFSVNNDDFRAHESDLEYDEELDSIYYDYTDDTAETPLGLIRGTDKVEVYHDNTDDLDWIKFTCAIWVKYNYKQVKKLLRSKNGYKKISVEVEVVDSEYTEDGIEIIKDFIFDGVTLLGDKYETGIANAKAKILDLFDNALFQKKQKALAFAYKALDEATNKVEILDAEKPQDSNIEEETFEEKAIVNEEPASEIEMDKELNQEGGEVVPMNLTMQAKINLLEAYLREVFNDWVWVCDLDEEYVYFSIECEEFRATYSITLDEVAEGEDQTGNVEVDVENKERVVRAWKVFSGEENSEENTEEFAAEEVSAEETVVTDEPVVAEEFVENDSEVVEETVEEFAEEPAEECKMEDCNCEECAAEDECKMEDGCDEPEDECKMEEEQPEDECKMESDEECKMEDDCDDCDDCGEEEFASNEEPEEVSEPEKFEAEEVEVVNATVELDGENMDVFALLEKYNTLKEEVNRLSEVVEMAQKEKFIQVGVEFINADELVDEESKNNFVAQITAKVEANEFKVEEDVTNFAKSLVAMYYYENQVSHTNKSNNDFSIGIENQKGAAAKKTDKLQEAITKLNKLN